MDFDWKSIVRTVAPSIASVFGTPLAGMAVKAVADAVLGPDEAAKPNPEQKLEAALAKASPELLQKVREADQKFKLDMEKLGVDLEKLAAEDRASARAREIAVRDWTPKILASVYTAGYFALLFLLLLYGLPEKADQTAKDILQILMGIMSAAQVSIMNYYFGSSAGSARKTELLGK